MLEYKKEAVQSVCKNSGKIEMSHHVFSWWLFSYAGNKEKPRARRGERLFKAFGIFGDLAELGEKGVGHTVQNSFPIVIPYGRKSVA